jgi:hypothetical protein
MLRLSDCCARFRDINSATVRFQVTLHSWRAAN